jgi:SseB protein N-terminal domain
VTEEWRPDQADPPDEATVRDPERGKAEPVGESEPPEEREPGLAELIAMDLVVPIRSSGGAVPDPSRIPSEALRHGQDSRGQFLAAFTSLDSFANYGPPGSDSITLPARSLFERADQAGERVLIDPGSAAQVEVAAGVLPFLIAGIDPATPEALRARRPLGALPQLEAPAAIPEPFGSALQAALTELTEVQRAWLLRAGTGWTVGIELSDAAPLAEFDAVRNRLHALAAEHLGSRRELIVTDLRGRALRDRYASIAAPIYEIKREQGFLDRLLGR